jgi:hypothetical protein
MPLGASPGKNIDRQTFSSLSMAEYRTYKPPSALVPWPGLAEGSRIWVGLRECFEGELNDVEILTWPLPTGMTRDRWIVKGLVRAPFYRKVLEGWSRSEKWTLGFQPQCRLAEPLLMRLQSLGDADLVSAFDHLRRQGLLLPQRKLSRHTWPKDMAWEGGRFSFIDLGVSQAAL